jgi:isoamyl acetate esterase
MPDVPRVLLLGDSIRMSYQPHVKITMEPKGEATVTGPAENCRYSAYTLERLPHWLNELGTPDVVHWNNGLHDAGHDPARDPVQFPLSTYVEHLKQIIALLRATDARIIWATSTPVHPDRPFSGEGWSWRNEEIDTYNTAALGLMQAEDIPVNDLHSVVWERYGEYLDEDMLHLNKHGQRACAKAVVSAVRSQYQTL